MRPAGEISQALLQAARDIAQEGRGATMWELAARACVSRDVATDRVEKLKSRGHLQQVGERRVDYRNRPVAEYAPPLDVHDGIHVMSGGAILGQCMADWVR
jgi:hypothetical protein